ncbi:MAG TPA: CoA pyrophosphatase [Stellaceae bacterium]|nr:CoA pyrophosphatase [Stellaceae bacterium]
MRERFRGLVLTGRRYSDSVRGDHTLSGGAPPAKLTPAAVLIGLADRPEGLSVLLTQRTPHLTDHGGQISLPGGRIDPTDRDPVHAALREAQEEIGLPPDQVEVVGRLDSYITGTGYEITPIVGLVRVPFENRLSPEEVAELFEVPLRFILDPANHRQGTRELRGQERRFYILPYENRYIWGATAAILVNLAEVLGA